MLPKFRLEIIVKTDTVNMTNKEWVSCKPNTVTVTSIFFIFAVAVIVIGGIWYFDAVPLRKLPVMLGTLTAVALVGLAYWIFRVIQNHKYGLLVSETGLKYDGKVYSKAEIAQFEKEPGELLAGVVHFTDGKKVQVKNHCLKNSILRERLASLLS